MAILTKIHFELVSPTKFDWRNLALSITDGCTTTYQRCFAIYLWLGQNIAYDTSLRIRKADIAIKRKKGSSDECVGAKRKLNKKEDS